MDNILERTKQHLLETFEKGKENAYPYLPRHVAEVEKWARKIMGSVPDADENIVLLSVWLHDIGQAIGDEENDHAVKSEEEAKAFLKKEGLGFGEIEKVAHCVRAHRCKDVQPETIEAKILAVADSASHMTDINYIVHLSIRPKEWILGKLERDYRDIGLFPEIQKEMIPLYQAWKALLTAYPKL